MNEPMFRPPAEAWSLVLQVDRGCPHNGCTFCGMYRKISYRRLPLPEVAALIRSERRIHPVVNRIFLADGDVFSRPYSELVEILRMLNEVFPEVSRISLYANGGSIASKTADQLMALRGRKLHTLYMGLESGSDDILKSCGKRESVKQMVEAGRSAQAAGLRMSVMLLLGLGGVDGSAEHTKLTAEALNRMQPRLLSALRVIPVPGTELYEQVRNGLFTQLSERQAVCELRDIIGSLEMKATVFRANHSSNVVPLEGRLPRDKERLLAELDDLLQSGLLDEESPGRMPLML